MLQVEEPGELLGSKVFQQRWVNQGLPGEKVTGRTISIGDKGVVKRDGERKGRKEGD